MKSNQKSKKSWLRGFVAAGIFAVSMLGVSSNNANAVASAGPVIYVWVGSHYYCPLFGNSCYRIDTAIE